MWPDAGRLPDLPALVPGLGRRRGRRPRGDRARLDHLVGLGVDALWLSPIYPSPMADFGYDVADYTGVDPVYGTLADFDALVAAAHERGLRLLMDLVPCHTSIEHPWFREHPDWYIWSPGDGRRTTGSSAFGGLGLVARRARALVPALVLSRAAGPRLAQPRGGGGDAGRVPLLARARRGRLPDRRDRPAAEGPGAARRPAGHGAVRPAAARGGGAARAALTRATRPTSARRSPRCARRRATRSWWGRCTSQPRAGAPYLEHFDAVFAFELLHCALGRRALRSAIEAPPARGAPRG